MSQTCQIGRPDQIDRLIAVAATLNLPGRVALLRAVRRGEINLIEVDRQGVPPSRFLKRSHRPVIAIVGDDDYAATGPTGWVATRRLLSWARSALIHATGADERSYQMAIDQALGCHQFVLVETDTAHAREWGEALLARRVPCIALVPRDGGQHPLPLDRKHVQ